VCKSLFAGGWVLKIVDCMSRARSVERYMGASGHESSHCVTPTQLTRHSDCLLAEQKELHDCNSVRLSSNPAMETPSTFATCCTMVPWHCGIRCLVYKFLISSRLVSQASMQALSQVVSWWRRSVFLAACPDY